MKIYVCHTRRSDFQNELYIPLRGSELNKLHEIILPHEDEQVRFNSKAVIKSCALVVAEVSYPATGLGIELGWTDDLGIPLVCIYKKGVQPSRSLQEITTNFIEYTDSEDLLNKLSIFVATLNKPR